MLAGAATAFAASPTPLSFNRDFRPILSENCFQYHGPDANRRKGDLRLDSREAALEAMAFVPGNPDKSELVRRIFETDEEERMPPIDSHRSLTPAQKQLLQWWVAASVPRGLSVAHNSQRYVLYSR
jgi:hypothetical protein